MEPCENKPENYRVVPLCALLVLLSVYFLTNQKFALGAAVAGLIPYARSEGFIVLFAVGIYLLFFKKEYRLLVRLCILRS